MQGWSGGWGITKTHPPPPDRHSFFFFIHLVFQIRLLTVHLLLSNWSLHFLKKPPRVPVALLLQYFWSCQQAVFLLRLKVASKKLWRKEFVLVVILFFALLTVLGVSFNPFGYLYLFLNTTSSFFINECENFY